MAADTSHHIIGLIPSRWGSSRFPGKPLHPIAGKPLVQHVWERVCRCSRLDAIAIATDDQRIFDAAVSFGARAIMTSPDHPSGSDRLAEAVRSFPAATHVVNIQGDEPLIDPALIDRLAEALVSDEALSMATVACPISAREDLDNPNIVKVALARNGDALYFSRSIVPYTRSVEWKEWLATTQYFTHIGMYAYRSEVLKEVAALPQSWLEKAESLEQLRWLENGYRIGVGISDVETIGIDTPEDLAAAEEFLKRMKR